MVYYYRNVNGFGLDDCEKDEGTERIDLAIKLAVDYGGIDGAHHKDWCIDQIVRTLSGEEYDKIVADAKDGEDGPNTYSWSCGIAP